MRINRKHSLDASVTHGLGDGKKNKDYVRAFFSAMWPVLQTAGWTLVKGEGEDEGLTYFVPPGVIMGDEEEGVGPCDCTNVGAKPRCAGTVGGSRNQMACRCRKRHRKAYFTKVCDVVKRVLEKNNAAEAAAAEAYTELVPDVAMFTEQKDKKEQKDKHSGQLWKDERTHFNKSSSRVGPEYQVLALPTVGSYTSSSNVDILLNSFCCLTCHFHATELRYERVWDPEVAQKLGRLDFVHTFVKHNKKEAAYDLFHSRGYILPGFYQDVSRLSPDDCSDWTKEDKARFRAAVFEHHENMREISKNTGKSINQCITYYLGCFKRTKSYKSLRKSMKRKANLGKESTNTWICIECSTGGMLIACDLCEGHYHFACASPPLESIPDGTWICGNCRRETRSMMSSQDEMICGTDHPFHVRSADASTDIGGHISRKELSDFEDIGSAFPRDEEVKSDDFATVGVTRKRNFKSGHGHESTQAETKRKRMLQRNGVFV
ncbi:hypothetical protein ACHAW5_008784 [Stephanodiscus triporus]|uniref:PHD-type domain-containing protein n=1 Tax=Stephanodiscus triporus TaxID=2934178 RepID=A0ABD3PES7_9STRA